MYCARQQASPRGHPRAPPECADADIVNPSGACLLHGSFVLRNGGGGHSTDRRSNIRPPFTFAFVRNPLDRFLSTFRPPPSTRSHPSDWARDYDPHGSWQDCSIPLGKRNASATCRGHIADLKSIAGHLEDNLRKWASGATGVQRHGLLTHALTQMYFLSGTDAHGTPLALDYIGRLESFAEDWEYVARKIGATHFYSKPTQMNDGSVPQWLREAVESEPAIVCPLCRIYAQDYACFGYDLPPACVQDGGALCRTRYGATTEDVLLHPATHAQEQHELFMNMHLLGQISRCK